MVGVDGMIELILGDSMKIMDTLKMKFDMIFLDPQYFEWEIQKSLKPDHNRLSILTYQLLKPYGTVFLFGTQPQLAKDFHYWARLFRLNFEMVAVKHAGTPPISMKRPIPIHENVWCLWRKRDSLRKIKINIKGAAKRSKGKIREGTYMPTRYGEERKSMLTGVGYPKSVINVKRIDVHSKEYEGHPAQKPLKLTRLVIKMSTDEGDWILDPFAGVGTTPVVCKELNRNCIAIEINREYVRLYKRRFERMKSIAKLRRWIK